MTSSSTSSIPRSFNCDMFLSFRGENTRTNFTHHLYSALELKSIYTYKDNERIKKGKRIDDELIRSIHHCFLKELCIFVLVFGWACEDNGVPQDNQHSGTVGEAFADGHEAKFIQKFVEELSLELRFINFSIDAKLVGMESRVKDVLSSLETGTDDIRVISIKRMGGGEKTTLARAIFDQISFRVEGKSFVENVSKVSNASLQNQVLPSVLNGQGTNISSVYDGKNMMRGRKVLVVLDDVDHIDQLEALAGDPSWFKAGSIIIITTRDEQVRVAHIVNLVQNVHFYMLSDKEGICLFCKYAFGREIPFKGYEELTEQVVRYAAGLPLLRRVLGSFLCGKNELNMLDSCLNLRSLLLTNSKLRTFDIGLTPNLEYLDLKYCHDLEELSMEDECQKLASLDISHSKLRNIDIGLITLI